DDVVISPAALLRVGRNGQRLPHCRLGPARTPRAKGEVRRNARILERSKRLEHGAVSGLEARDEHNIDVEQSCETLHQSSVEALALERYELRGDDPQRLFRLAALRRASLDFALEVRVENAQ